MKNKKKIFISSMIAFGSVAIFTVSAYALNPNNSHKNIFAKVAEVLDISEDDLTDAFKTVRTEEVYDALENGDITDEQAERMLKGIENGQFFRGKKGRKPNPQINHEELAKFLNLDEDSLKELLVEEEKSLLEIATDQGISEDNLVDYLYEQGIDRLDQALANDKISQEKYDEIKKDLKDKINERITHKGHPDHKPMNDKHGNFDMKEKHDM